jgi:hypothetical protein
VKHLKKHWGARPLSVLLSVLMALPVLSLFLLRINAAQAQSLNARQPTWAVLDFANPSGYGSSDVGRLASDSFVVQLAKLNRYTVLPREQLLTGIQNENLTPPLNLTSIERLGQSLGVDAIVAGEISSISFSRDRRQAKVSIAVRVIDPKSGYLLNGALAEGLSNPRPIPVDDEEQLVNEAFGNAAFNAVKQLSKFDLPVATVIISGNNTLNGHNVTVTINKGTRDGIYSGLDMLISRRGQYVGTIRVAEPTDNDANAEITDLGLGIEPGDRATAIFHMPVYTVDKATGSYQTATSADLSADTPTTPGHASAFKGLGGILLAVLSGALLLSAIHAGHTGNDDTLGGANISNVAANAGRVETIDGGSTVIPAGLSYVAGYRSVAVKITANIGNIDTTNFLEFHVYRSDSPTDLSNAQFLLSSGVAGVTTSTASNTNGNTNGGTGTNTSGTTTGVGLLGINGYGQVPILAEATNQLAVFDDFNLKTSIVASKPDPSDSTTLVTLAVSTFGIVAGTTTTGTTGTTTGTTGTTTGTTGTTSVNSAFAGGIPGTGLGFGQRVSYAIEGLYIQPSTFSTGNDNTGLNPGTGSTGTSTNGNTNTSGNTNTNGNSGGNNGNTNGSTGGTTNTSGTNTNSNTSGTTTTGHGETFQLTSLRTTNTITYIVPVALSATSVTSTGSANVNITVPATAGANDYILEISSDPGFQSNVKSYHAAPGAYNVLVTPSPAFPFGNPNQEGGNISTATGTAVVFNNIDLTTDFSGSTSLFYKVGARNSADNGQSNYSNGYVYSDPLSLGLTGAALRPSLEQLNAFHKRGRF